MRASIPAGLAASLAVALAVVPAGASAAVRGAEARVPPLAARTALEPNPLRYGDPLVAEVDVVFDPHAVAQGSITLKPDFAPFVQTSPPSVSRTTAANAATLRYRYTLLCLTDACLPTKHARRVRFAPVKVTGTDGKRTLTVTASWPPAVVSTRLAPSDVSGSIRFRNDRTLPPPVFAVAPGPLAGGLIAVAALCTLAAALLIGRALLRARSRAREIRLTPLELALVYTRDSAQRPDPADRRKALDMLAEAVGHSGEPELARVATETAWVEDPPSPARAIELADEVEGAHGGGGS